MQATILKSGPAAVPITDLGQALRSLCFVAAIAVVLGPAEKVSAQTLGVIAGIVEDDRRQPVAGARVTLTGPALRESRATVTDNRGRFVFLAVPSGRFSVTAQKPGYVRGQYGARTPGGPGAPVVLAAGQRLDTLTVAVARGGVITGTIFDPDGSPTAGVAVRALRVMTQSGERRLVQVGGDSSDDRGVYRIYQLMPGTYFVSATPRDGDSDRATASPPVYYPGSSAFGGAASVALAISEERSGVDISLPSFRAVVIDGRIMPAATASGCQTTVALVPMSNGDVASPADVSTVDVEDSRFEIGGVLPGTYRLLARCGTGSASPRSPAPLWASTDLVVGTSDMHDVVLPLRPGMTVSGRVAFDGPRPSSASSRGVRLALVERGVAANEIGGTHFADVAPDGRFVVSGLPPGRYDVEASVSGGGAGDWAMESATVAGRDAADFALEIPPDEHVADMLVTFSNRTQGVVGRLVDQRDQPVMGYTVVAFPVDTRYWLAGSRRVRAVRVGADGTYAISRLPPGDYRLAAVDDLFGTDWDDPDVLQLLVPASVPVTVRRGAQATLPLRVAANPID